MSLANGVRVTVVLTLAASLLACAKKDERPRPEGFVDVLDTIGRVCADATNTFECAKAVELYRLAKGVAGVTRVGKRLSIALKAGTVVDLTDAGDPGADGYVAYGYTEYLTCFGYHLVHRQLFDRDSYLAIHAESGARFDLASVPILSPDCERLVSVAGEPNAASLAQIWRLTDTGRATLEWGYQPEAAWTPGTPTWQTTTLLAVPYVTADDPQTRRTLSVRLYTDGLRVEK